MKITIRKHLRITNPVSFTPTTGRNSPTGYPSGEREPTGTHVFDRECRENGIEHRLIRPRGPRTNGMVERFNGGIREVVQQTEFESSRQLKETLRRYLRIYNHHIPQKNLGHITPTALKKWRGTHPHLFEKQVYNLSGLDK